MTRTRRLLLAALGIALPIELVNFFVFMPPLDVGIPDDAGWGEKLLFYQWGVLHYPGIGLMNRIDPYYKVFPLDLFIWFLSGYVVTALVMFGIISGIGWILRSRSRSQEILP